mmetsp:Transcript_13656/g.31462  ORF Transcript_13656/g.31462 Transcript_13656/m.31462 type:complete len:356 (-) Transcript_13656:280-1347(-)
MGTPIMEPETSHMAMVLPRFTGLDDLVSSALSSSASCTMASTCETCSELSLAALTARASSRSRAPLWSSAFLCSIISSTPSLIFPHMLWYTSRLLSGKSSQVAHTSFTRSCGKSCLPLSLLAREASKNASRHANLAASSERDCEGSVALSLRNAFMYRFTARDGTLLKSILSHELEHILVSHTCSALRSSARTLRYFPFTYRAAFSGCLLAPKTSPYIFPQMLRTACSSRSKAWPSVGAYLEQRESRGSRCCFLASSSSSWSSCSWAANRVQTLSASLSKLTFPMSAALHPWSRNRRSFQYPNLGTSSRSSRTTSGNFSYSTLVITRKSALSPFPPRHQRVWKVKTKSDLIASPS